MWHGGTPCPPIGGRHLEGIVSDWNRTVKPLRQWAIKLKMAFFHRLMITFVNFNWKKMWDGASVPLMPDDVIIHIDLAAITKKKIIKKNKMMSRTNRIGLGLSVIVSLSDLRPRVLLLRVWDIFSGLHKSTSLTEIIIRSSRNPLWKNKTKTKTK